MKPVVISQRIDYFPSHSEYRDTLDHRLISLALANKLLPYTLPNTLSTHLFSWLDHLSPHLIILSGGNDIQALPLRDKTELLLLDYCYAHSLPVFAICRGMQMLAYREGIPLRSISNHVATSHRLAAFNNPTVNSYHNLSIDRCPPSYEVIATADDGEIEAIRHRTLNWVGCMWHPERPFGYQSFFEEFLKQAELPKS